MCLHTYMCEYLTAHWRVDALDTDVARGACVTLKPPDTLWMKTCLGAREFAGAVPNLNKQKGRNTPKREMGIWGCRKPSQAFAFHLYNR